MQNLHITLLRKFPFLKYIFNMPCNYRLVFIKKFNYLRLRKPHSIIFDTNL